MKRFSLTMLAIVVVCGLLFSACSSSTKEDSETAELARAKNLPVGVWTSGIAYSGDRDSPQRPQWFRFTAPASVLYWHITNSSGSMSVYLHDSNGGFLERLEYSLGGGVLPWGGTFVVTSGQVYYIEVSESLGTAFFNLAITTSETPPPR